MAVVTGVTKWRAELNEMAQPEVKITYRVRCLPTEGPIAALSAQGLPVYGEAYTITAFEQDLWLWLHWNASAEPVVTNEPNIDFDVTLTFSNRPEERPCFEQQFTDPTLEPAKISGDFVNKSVEYARDRFGNLLTYSSHEPIRGEQVRFDENRFQLKITQNIDIAAFDLPLLMGMRDTVNAFPIWGMPSRTVKLSNASWERQPLGTCGMYIRRHLTFDINGSTFDRNVQDMGKLFLKGHWEKDKTVSPPRFTGNWIVENVGAAPADPNNPKHFVVAKDFKGQPYAQPQLLNGAGVPAGIRITNQFMIALVNGAIVLTNPTQWAPLNDPTNYQAWEEGVWFNRGDLIANEGVFYVVLADGALDLVDLDQNGVRWHQFPGAYPPGANNAGFWASNTPYNEGDYVQLTDEVRAGSRHIEAYPESDFTMLGVPLDLTSW